MAKVRNGSKGGFEPGSLDCDSGVLTYLDLGPPVHLGASGDEKPPSISHWRSGGLHAS